MPPADSPISRRRRSDAPKRIASTDAPSVPTTAAMTPQFAICRMSPSSSSFDSGASFPRSCTAAIVSASMRLFFGVLPVTSDASWETFATV